MMDHLIYVNPAIPLASIARAQELLAALHVTHYFLESFNFLKIRVYVNLVIHKIPSLNFVFPVIHHV
jgi:hypothetical protein